MESISDWLIKQGFEPNYTRDCFEKSGVFGYMTEIPFSSLAGHTIATFEVLAKKKNWINDETETVNIIGQSLGLYVGLNLVSVNSGASLEPWGKDFVPRDSLGHQYQRARIYEPGLLAGVQDVEFQCMTPIIFYGFLIFNHPTSGKIIHSEDFSQPIEIVPNDMLHIRFNLDNIKLDL